MTLHSLVLISDSFSCNCNSIQSPVSIVHLRVNLILSHPLLRLYINYSISNANQFQLAQQCIQISTRINSSSVHTYIFVCFTLRVILQGFVTQNATVFSVYPGYEGSRKTDKYGDSNPQYVLRNYQHEHWLNIMNYTTVG